MRMPTQMCVMTLLQFLIYSFLKTLLIICIQMKMRMICRLILNQSLSGLH